MKNSNVQKRRKDKTMTATTLVYIAIGASSKAEQ